MDFHIAMISKISLFWKTLGIHLRFLCTGVQSLLLWFSWTLGCFPHGVWGSFHIVPRWEELFLFIPPSGLLCTYCYLCCSSHGGHIDNTSVTLCISLSECVWLLSMKITWFISLANSSNNNSNLHKTYVLSVQRGSRELLDPKKY